MEEINCIAFQTFMHIIVLAFDPKTYSSMALFIDHDKNANIVALCIWLLWRRQDHQTKVMHQAGGKRVISLSSGIHTDQHRYYNDHTNDQFQDFIFISDKDQTSETAVKQIMLRFRGVIQMKRAGRKKYAFFG